MTEPNTPEGLPILHTVSELRAWLQQQPDDWTVYWDDDGIHVHSGWDDFDHFPVLNSEPKVEGDDPKVAELLSEWRVAATPNEVGNHNGGGFASANWERILRALESK